ncbi:hypothetical protein LA76x_3428 [Lysobacter antibioticus]|uniref:Uncharacterized protein n=1 Tax=Lysobacter antibioticus TaxID=84531 RepID=A0A0S2FDF0_LYSAN|nr:hypothetical protein LA76x_3428 [Lysobacter antibioticus]
MLGIEGAGAQTRTADPPEGRGRTSGRRRKIRGRVSKLPWSTTAQAVGGDGYCQNCILHCDRPAYVGFAHRQCGCATFPRPSSRDTPSVLEGMADWVGISRTGAASRVPQATVKPWLGDATLMTCADVGLAPLLPEQTASPG